MTSRVVPRRRFLKQIYFTVGAMNLSPRFLLGQRNSTEVMVTVKSGQPGVHVPSDFIGLSYENMQLEDPTFFSSANKGLISQFRSISPRGVSRLGGNTSEFGWWKATPDQHEPHRIDTPWRAAGEPTAATIFAITPEAVDNLNDFLVATGWTCIYGLNLGYGAAQTDTTEATYVANKLGSRLQYFQVGNEVDLFKGHLRDPETWNVKRYLEEWLTIARAVQKALPKAKFGFPDVAGDITWLPQLANMWASVTDKPNVVTMSHHYYWCGPPSNPQANIDNLLRTDEKVTSFAKTASAASKYMGPSVTWRMTEGNTVYGGGKSGVSDVFAAALWCADYLLHLMSLGYGGVNIHGGSGHAQAVSVGGVLHGEALMKDPTVPHPKPFYTPIANQGTLAGSGVDGKLNAEYILEPVGYGMQFVAPFAGATMLGLDFNPGTFNATAYAARKNGKLMVIVLNKDASQPLSVLMPGYEIASRLEGPSLDSPKARIVLTNLGHTPSPKSPDQALVVPPHTAVLLTRRT